MTSLKKSRGRKRTFALNCEQLEDRRVLAAFIVNNLGDTPDANPGDGVAVDASGNTTLRAAIQEANALGGADMITFSVSGTITLTLGQLTITDHLSIDGGNNITVNANNASRVFNIDNADGILANRDVTLSNIEVTGGSAIRGGGIFNNEDTTLINTTVTGNSVTHGAMAAFGGGILNQGTMSIQDSTISGNSAIHPTGSVTPSGSGGGIANYRSDASMTITDSVISGNSATKYGGGILNGQGYLFMSGTTVSENLAGSLNYYTGGAGFAAVSYLPSGNGASETVIQSSTIRDNVLDGNNFPYGAGIYTSGYGEFTITNSMVSGNSAVTGTAARGGGAMFYGLIISPGVMEITISDTTFDANFANSDGGAIGIRGRQGTAIRITADNLTMTNNTATFGSAVFNWSPSASNPDTARFNMTNATISGNTATVEGTVENFTGGQVYLRDSSLSGNYGASAVIYNQGFYLNMGFKIPEFVIVNSTISDNYSNGGYASAASTFDGHLTIRQSTISGNTAAGTGTVATRTDGPYVGTPNQGFTTIDQSTITGNTAFTGGGLYTDTYSTVYINNSIIAANSATVAPDVYSMGTLIPTFSLIGNNSGSLLIPANPDGAGNKIGSAGTPINPMLAALMNNGGTTLTHLPMAGSPAIDAGDPAVMGGTDQRGFVRVINGRVDMGSVEFGSSPPGNACDLDGDNDCDINDLNMLTQAKFLGMATQADINNWLVDAGCKNIGRAYRPGDANLDGQTDGQDFLTWNTNKFTPVVPTLAAALWSRADFDGSGNTDGADFLTWNANKFMLGATCSPGAALQSGGHNSVPKDRTSTVDALFADRSSSGKRIPAQRTGAQFAQQSKSAQNVQQVDLAASTAERNVSSAARAATVSVQATEQARSGIQAPDLSRYSIRPLEESVDRTRAHVNAAVDAVFSELEAELNCL